MSFPTESRRIRGALAFMAELHAIALECAETAVFDDELSLRRRQRDDARPVPTQAAEALVKAL
jgi:hypothetical protein